MLKEERLTELLRLIDEKGTVTVTDLVENMAVSDMTIRRDLSELDAQGRIHRIHGGAQSVNKFNLAELSHEKKKIIQPDEKKEIAQTALTLINEEGTIFLGPGTSIELLAQALTVENLRIITNSLPVFNILENKTQQYEIYLVGGKYRQLTGAFSGEMANKAIQDIRFSKAFLGTNAIHQDRIMTATMEEGITQSLALDNSIQKYLCVDSAKFNREDFYTFYHLSDLTAVITNNQLVANIEDYKKYTQIITKNDIKNQ
ncbi:DeoR/GlpR family DNA-binding transcription regulator [Enterococcus sp. 5H]|uniref:DeoR/GlpR family DNA-binding transcription regulator n=1 Tax=Enterococcus sp. 5H TaxID=1229490 RepID=UPI0023027F5B|nr:DeoR/GlpR family DNA-binding transcription regulator [Enterococcus sp. 5H]MDA9471883.1 Lactose phosphotransferase system repressor [Enterococcus sp. 5H]